MENLEAMSNEELNLNLKELSKKEREIICEVVRYLHEIDMRGYYRDLGYSSLFSYVTQALGYSEGGAQRRIQAARALRENPEIYNLLKDGKLTLCSVGEIAKVLNRENKEELLSSTQFKSKLQVQNITAQYKAPMPSKPKAIVRAKVVEVKAPSDLFTEPQPEPVLEKRYSISLEVDEEFMALYEKAKAIIGQRPMTEVLRKGLTDLIQKREVREAKAKRKSRGKGRYLPVSVKHEVHSRDEGRCTFVGADGHRCSETIGLQYDHIEPFALGGETTPENLRLLCPCHNRLLAERVFGDKAIKHRHSGGDLQNVSSSSSV